MPVEQIETSPGVYVNAKGAADGNMLVDSVITTKNAAALGLVAQVTPYGTLKISTEPGALFVDSFDGGTVDITNRWTLSGTAPTQANGVFTLNAGTVANATSVAISQPTFLPPGAGFRIFGGTAQLGATKVVNQNTNSFFGLGVVTSYAFATPLTDGMGFEVDATGELNCVIYIGGVRYVINSTNPALITAQGSLPTGGASAAFSAMSWPTAGPHIYAMLDRGDTVFFYIDSLEVPVAYAKNVQPNVQSLPIRVSQVNAAASVLASIFTVGSMGVFDSTSQNSTLSDPTYPWRRATISSTGALKTEQSYSYNHISTATTTVVKSGPGVLHSISVNTKGTVASTITVYDNTAGSGAVIGIVDSLNLSGAFVLDVSFGIGLTIVTTGTVAPDITVSYR